MKNSYHDKYLEMAKKEDPSAAICGFCFGVNTWVDDCGWWYLDPWGAHDSRPCCEKCKDYGLLEMHQEHYGVGDR